MPTYIRLSQNIELTAGDDSDDEMDLGYQYQGSQLLHILLSHSQSQEFYSLDQDQDQDKEACKKIMIDEVGSPYFNLGLESFDLTYALEHKKKSNTCKVGNAVQKTVENDSGKIEALVGVIHSYDPLAELYTIKFATDKGLCWETMKEEDVKESQRLCLQNCCKSFAGGRVTQAVDILKRSRDFVSCKPL